MRRRSFRKAIAAAALAFAAVGAVPAAAKAAALAGPSCDFNGDGRSDLAVGSPGESVGSLDSAGAVNVLYGWPTRLRAANNQIWDQDSPGIEGVATAYDRFGGPAVSNGEYRIGYTSGTGVVVTRDHLSHSPSRYRIDMAGTGAGPHTIVAARAGIIRFIVDGNAEPTEDNNYMWIEHPDGEWSKYTHFRTGSVTALGHQAGDSVTAGTALGIEGDVGAASGEHLHFEIAVPDDPANPINGGGFILGHNRIPHICGIPGNLFVHGQTYIAGAC